MPYFLYAKEKPTRAHRQNDDDGHNKNKNKFEINEKEKKYMNE